MSPGLRTHSSAAGERIGRVCLDLEYSCLRMGDGAELRAYTASAATAGLYAGWYPATLSGTELWGMGVGHIYLLLGAYYLERALSAANSPAAGSAAFRRDLALERLNLQLGGGWPAD